MTQFIKLTEHSSKREHFVNAAHIRYFGAPNVASGGKSTYLDMAEAEMYVTETPEQILALIEGVKE